jgi:hypothetical protein
MHQRTSAFELATARDLGVFFDLDYFRRGWIFQELILASPLVLISGDSTIKWTTLLHGVGRLDSAHFLKNKRPQNLGSVVQLAHAWMMLERPLAWNRRRIREPVDGSSSFMAYQHALKRTLTVLDYHEHGLSQGSLRVFVFLLVILALVLGPFIYAIIAIGGIAIAAYPVIIPMSMVPFRIATRGFKMWTPTEPRLISDHRSRRETLLLRSILRALRERQFGNRKDHSYGFYAILAAMEVELHDVDYRKPEEEIYRNFFIDLLNWNSISLVLVMDAGLHNRSTQASWVPNFSRIGPGWVADECYYEHGHDFAGRSGYTLTRSATMYSKGLFHITADHLTLQGHYIDSANLRSAHTSCTLNEGDDDLSKLQALRDWIAGVRAFGLEHSWEPESTIPTGIRDAIEGYDFALGAGGTRESDSTIPPGFVGAISFALSARRNRAMSPPKSQLLFNDWFRVVTGTAKDFHKHIRLAKNADDSGMSALQDPGIELDADFPSNPSGKGQRPDAEDFLGKRPFPDVQQILAVIQGHPEIFAYHQHICKQLAGKRRLFVTQRGFIGTGPLMMKVSDEIYLISGVPVPLILRPTEEPGTFRLVGPALIHGVMNGQLWMEDGTGLDTITLV